MLYLIQTVIAFFLWRKQYLKRAYHPVGKTFHLKLSQGQLKVICPAAPQKAQVNQKTH